MPTVEDALRIRVRTSGVVTESYVIDGVKFDMYDVGGQRSERKKWIHCFDDVTAIIFVAAMSEYDQVLYEDATQNRLLEAVKVFGDICNGPCVAPCLRARATQPFCTRSMFAETSIILFLNKRDLFQDKIKRVDLRAPAYTLPDGTAVPARFSDYTHGICTCGESNPSIACSCRRQEAAARYISQLFLEARRQATKAVYVHMTCATDTNNVRFVFNSCKDIILKQSLASSGFMTLASA
jgi:guanine nucleotide-binding protein G(i) subunit alpha